MNTSVVVVMVIFGVASLQQVNAIRDSAKSDAEEDEGTIQQNMKPEVLGSVTSHVSERTNSSAGIYTKRTKRAVVGQCQMMRHRLQGTGKGCLDFDNYGNWCGRGGSGTCVDDIDDCCYTHDKCWDAVKDVHDHNCFWSMYVFNNFHDPCGPTVRGNAAQKKCCRCDWAFAGCISNYVRAGKYNAYYKGRSGLWPGTRSCNREWSFW